MGTILSRRRKDGSLGYTARMRIRRQGKYIRSTSETFDRRQLAIEERVPPPLSNPQRVSH